MKVKLDIVNIRSTTYRPAWMVEHNSKKEVIAITFKDQLSYYHFIESDQYRQLHKDGIRVYSWCSAPRPKAEIEADKESHRKIQEEYPQFNVPFHADRRYLIIHIGSSTKSVEEVVEGIKKYCDSPVLDKFTLMDRREAGSDTAQANTNDSVADSQNILSK
jgi:hypothetical protein